MIREVDEVILKYLREGLSGSIPPENITIGESGKKKTKAISLISDEFVIEETGIGSSGGIKKEEITDSFDADGEKKDFSLSQKPLKPLISVENPLGTVKRDTDDYTVDYENGTVSFRAAPEKAKNSVRIKFMTSRAVAETRYLRFVLNNSLIITAEDMQEINKLALEALKVLYVKKAAMAEHGIEEFKLIKGYSSVLSDNEEANAGIIDYQVAYTVEIEIPMQPMESIEVGRITKK